MFYNVLAVCNLLGGYLKLLVSWKLKFLNLYCLLLIKCSFQPVILRFSSSSWEVKLEIVNGKSFIILIVNHTVFLVYYRERLNYYNSNSNSNSTMFTVCTEGVS